MQCANTRRAHPYGSQILCCLIGATYAGIRAAGSDVKAMYYIWGADGEGGPQSPALTIFLKFWSFVIIFTNFVPISLLITLDMVKVFQSSFIGWDRAMYHEAREFDGTRRPMPAQVIRGWTTLSPFFFFVYAVTRFDRRKDNMTTRAQLVLTGMMSCTGHSPFIANKRVKMQSRKNEAIL